MFVYYGDRIGLQRYQMPNVRADDVDLFAIEYKDCIRPKSANPVKPADYDAQNTSNVALQKSKECEDQTEWPRSPTVS